jgi:cytoskeletal protein CcmA (bactofilin family)
MRIVSNIVNADLEIADAVHLSGMVRGTVTVAAGGDLKMTGMISGDLVVRPDARARVSGMVSGTVRNQGGDVEISGMVRRLVTEPGSAADMRGGLLGETFG